MIRVLVGHFLDRLAELPAESVHCVRAGESYKETIGWRSTCSCKPAGGANGDDRAGSSGPTAAAPFAPVPATVIDPFLGAGTTALVADRLGRHCIGVELNPKYAAMAELRVRDDAGLFAAIAAE